VTSDASPIHRFTPRASLVLALVLVLIGVTRSITDTLHELDPDYWRAVEGTHLRYAIRAPTDGTFLGDLNAQWFKLLSIPSGISLIYLRSRFSSGTDVERESEFHDWAVYATWLFVFFVGFTVIELQKHLAFLPFNTRLVEGEDPFLNHLAHVLSALLAWQLALRLTIAPRNLEPV
jgi:hypothetical protein